MLEQLNAEISQRARDKQRPLPSDTAIAFRIILDGMIDDELLIAKAESFKLTVTDDELNKQVDAQVKDARSNYNSDAELLDALKQANIPSLDLWRSQLRDQFRRRSLEKKVLDTLTALGRMPKVNVTEKEIQAAYDSAKTTWTDRGPTITFRQIIIRPSPRDDAEAKAKKLADSLLTLLRAGASFDTLAHKFSADSGSAAQGGQLDWLRRGDVVPQFGAMMFSTSIGQLSPVFRTRYGYHILRVDRVRAGEVKARHILIRVPRDSTDLDRARVLGDSVAAALRAGKSFDSLAARYNDNELEKTRVFSDPYPISAMPDTYQPAVKDLKANEVSKAFPIPPDQNDDLPKIVVLQVLGRNDTGIPTLYEMRERLRGALQTAASWRRLLDGLRRETHVSITL